MNINARSCAGRFACAGLILLAAAAYAGTHVTRFVVQSGSNSTQIDITHGLPTFDFKGEKPVLRVLSGDKQKKTSGYLPQPITVGVYHADGITPWPKAPVTLAVEYGAGGWTSTPGGAVSATLTLSANNSGVVEAYYWMP